MSDKAALIARLRNEISSIEGGAASFEQGLAPLQDSRCASSDSRLSKSPSTQKRSASSKSVAASEEGAAESEAFRKIVRSLSVCEQSSVKMRAKLMRAGFEEGVVDAAMEKAQRLGVIDDHRYAESYLRSSIAAGRGLKLVEIELGQLGISLYELEAYQDLCSSEADFELSCALRYLDSHPPRSKNARDGAYRKLMGKRHASDVAARAARIWAEGRPS